MKIESLEDRNRGANRQWTPVGEWCWRQRRRSADNDQWLHYDGFRQSSICRFDTRENSPVLDVTSAKP